MSGTTSSAPGPEYPYVLFWEWDITPSNPASMACFSQWFDRTFAEPDDPSVVYKTAEHYMMYHKALLFDPSVAQSILKAATPEEAKQRGNYLKFGQNEDLKGYLLDTGEKVMVEASPTDRVWGIGFSVENAPGREKEWGDNRWVCGGLCVGSADHRMGLALTRAKKQLRKESEE
jgi:predicted NAD-dependent protein-ADP-ribosyltransferase YbiA (DUF1768 family)